MYLKWQETKIEDFSEKNISKLYNQGFVFTRIDRGILNQTRSLRIDLKNFKFTSENKRILRKTENIKLENTSLPYSNYNWSIAKLAKDFYEKKFGKNIFSANKIKEILTTNKNNFNQLLIYKENDENIGFAICYENEEILHYSYPFYNLKNENKNIGMGMMLKAIEYAKKNNKKYVYLGSAQRPSDVYKFQFKNMEFFSGENWSKNFDDLKEALKYGDNK